MGEQIAIRVVDNFAAIDEQAINICFTTTLLFLRKHNQDGYEQEQIFIEPKGDHLLSEDKRKEDFLLRIGKEGIPVKVYVDDNKYRVCGLPFFNINYRMDDFDQALRSKVR